MLAAKSAGPKMMVSSRGLAAQISSTLMSPRAVSICASIPMWPIGKPAEISTWRSNMSVATICAADSTFGNMISSRRSPALPTTSMMSYAVHLVLQSFTRTHNTLSPQSLPRIAAAIFARDASFSLGATASSRSRNTMSAGIPGPLPSIFSDEPGIDRHERRGRLRERADMAYRLHRTAHEHLGRRGTFSHYRQRGVHNSQRTNNSAK